MRYLKSGSLATALAASLFVVACGSGGGDTTDSATQRNRNINLVEVTDVPGKPANFVENMTAVAMEPMLVLNTIDNIFNNRTINVIYSECFRNGGPFLSPHYDPSVDTAYLCDQFVDLALETFILAEYSDEATYISTLGAMNFVMFHELGHGIVTENQHALGGNPESIVDAMGVVLSELTGQAYSAIFAADLFLSLAQRESGSTFLGQHPASEDRAGDIVCWWLGANVDNPERTSSLQSVANGFAASGRDCVGEYADQEAFVLALVPELNNIRLTAAASPVSEEQAALEEEALNSAENSLLENLNFD